MARRIHVMVRLLSISLLLGFAMGCASTVPKPQFSKEIAPESCIAAQDQTRVRVEAGSDVFMIDVEKLRLAEKVKLKIDAFKAAKDRDGSGKSYDVDLVITRYDKGNAFARAMLAGLGQIHVDGEVSVYEQPDRNLVGQFTISKTFAWGGIYGASTSIEDIETTFAEGVAAALTGKPEQGKSASKTGE
jgi:hypothetical protein